MAAFLAFWVLLLSLLPCSDVDDHSHLPEMMQAVGPQLQLDSHGDHSPEAEHCAPFCHCNCCQSTVTIYGAAVSLPLPATPIVQHPLLHDQLVAHPRTAVWHPPIA